ncbi:MAG: hydrogenase expression/formation protein HypE, partial [Pirellulaceae bacterium]
AELVDHVFLPAFTNQILAELGDSAVFDVDDGRLAFSTDSYVVQPLFFPGGCIGDLAINGTVNDLAMSGARPIYLSAGFIIEEGCPIDRLTNIVEEMKSAADRANVSIITGDTKVIESGRGDGCFINTSGIGIVPPGINIAPSRAEPGDTIMISGTIGDHGMAVMSVREGLEFESQIKSDSAPLHDLVANMLKVCPDIHVLRDPTRGGLAATLNEIARFSKRGIVIDETALPIAPNVAAACEILGLDPLHVANEGKLVCILPATSAAEVLLEMKSHRVGANATIIGTVVPDHPGLVVAKTSLGASRVISIPIGEQLPRIC